IPQSRFAGLAYGQVLPLVPRVTETQFPVPSLEIIAKFSHLTFEPNVKESIPVSELFVSGTSVVNTAKPNSRSHRDWYSVNNQSRISNCERVERILNWHTDTGGTEGGAVRIFEWVRSSQANRHSCEECIEKRARIFEIGKHRQVFVTQIARERAVEGLPIRRRKIRCDGRKVISHV